MSSFRGNTPETSQHPFFTGMRGNVFESKADVNNFFYFLFFFISFFFSFFDCCLLRFELYSVPMSSGEEPVCCNPIHVRSELPCCLGLFLPVCYASAGGFCEMYA